jgi:hypothetical protein
MKNQFSFLFSSSKNTIQLEIGQIEKSNSNVNKNSFENKKKEEKKELHTPNPKSNAFN